MENKMLGRKINEVSRLFHKKVKSVASDNGISTTYFHIIGFLRHNSDKNITQKDICDFIKMKPSTISLTLQSMEQEGYVKRVKSEEDSRCTVVVITDEGVELDNRVRVFFKIVEEIVQTAITEEEYEVFSECLEKIERALED